MEHLSENPQITELLTRQHGTQKPSSTSARSEQPEERPRFFQSNPKPPLREHDYKCERCKDMKWVADEQTGRLARCGGCTDWIASSRLNPYERGRIDDIVDRSVDEDPGCEARAVRFMCKEMLRDPFGFLSFAGVMGNAKSMALTALVAEFCRRGRQAVYYTAPEICRGPNSLTDFENGDPQALTDRLKRASVLAIDELDKLKWTEYQIETLGDIIDHRHRNADTQVTLFSMNRRPAEWRNADDVTYIASRLSDGRFNRYWPEQYNSLRPACAVKDGAAWYIPGLLELTAADVRPRLRRDATA